MIGRSRCRLVAVWFALAVWLPAAPVCAGMATADDDNGEIEIVNGNHTQEFETTGALLKQFGFGLGTACSGTLVGCRTFLTAAHCVCPGDTYCVPDPSDFRVYLQHGGILPVASVAVPLDFNYGVRGDIAVVQLESPIDGIAPASLNFLSTPAYGTPGTIVGFGKSKASADDAGIKRAGRVTTESCAASPLIIPEPAHICWVFDSPLGPAGDDSNTCLGDSGGPLFIGPAGGSVLAGVTSGGENSTCLRRDVSFDSNVLESRLWIEATAGSDLVLPTCGSLSRIGEPETTVVRAGNGALTKATGRCRKDVTKNASKYVAASLKAMRKCVDGVIKGKHPGPCPDERALKLVAKAQARLDPAKLGKKCAAGIAQASLLGGACSTVADPNDLQACIRVTGDTFVHQLIQVEYANGSYTTGMSKELGRCQIEIAKQLGKYASSRLRALAGCQKKADGGKVASCPDERTAAKIAKAASKVQAGVAKRCSDAQILELGGLGGTQSPCASANTVDDLVACQITVHDFEIDQLAQIVEPVQATELVRIEVPESTARMRVTLNGEDPVSGTPNNLDLYLRYGAPASAQDYDYKSATGGVFEGIDIATPAVGTWYAYVDEVEGSRVEFQLTASLFQ